MKIKRARIIDHIRQTFCALYPEYRLDDPTQCLRWAHASCVGLRSFGILAIPVVGSMSWQIVPDHLDDGICATHFSYEFSPSHPLSQLSMRAGNLPEMHAWACLPEVDEILDLTTRHLKAQCRRIAPTTQWLSPDPPVYLWARSDQLPLGAEYRPDLLATELVHDVLLQFSRQRLPHGPTPA